ncbi:Ppx/GppA phosphatase family protein [Paraferrimonas sp. SM1919]|uniref:Ppx/GppA phosphatase family protein n=1 Tax=Paraferrimonas sp. SM1919 TaxID=2662263 RepID=UPI0013D8C5D6|nr:Ppx/GppA phosphatase family protein [Paraferrimonas sp. SM1919]
MINPQQQFVVIDIGSNSFHLVIARLQDGQLQILHKEKQAVQLAQGLNNNNYLEHKAFNRGLNCLADFNTRFNQLNVSNVKIVATHTLRVAINSKQFLQAALKVIPYPIEILSGTEEARLIYQGICVSQDIHGDAIALDIGGGSTEVIVAEDKHPQQLQSLRCGCVSFTKKYFNDGKLTPKSFAKAIDAADRLFKNLPHHYFNEHWHNVVASSGTAKAIVNIINGNTEHPISLHQLQHLKQQCIELGHCDKLNFEGVDANRNQVLAAGLAILIAFSQRLGVRNISYAAGALREGVLYEMANIEGFPEVQTNTIENLIKLYHIDRSHSAKVTQTALAIFDRVKQSWHLTAEHRLLLQQASLLHEIGIHISAKSHHKHGAYIIKNSHLSGISAEQQMLLAELVGHHRKKIDDALWKQFSTTQYNTLVPLVTILRLAVIFNLGRKQVQHLADLVTATSSKTITINLVKENNRLLYQDLANETKKLKSLAIAIKLI